MLVTMGNELLICWLLVPGTGEGASFAEDDDAALASDIAFHQVLFKRC